MSVSLNFYIEVKDKDGVWHLVKWFADRYFDTHPEDEKGEKVVTIENKKYTECVKKWVGLAWRDEFLRLCNNRIIYNGLPSDISQDLKEHLENEYKEYLALPDEYRFSPKITDFAEYAKRYQYTYLDDMLDICEERMDGWKQSVINSVKELQHTDVITKLNTIENLVRGEKTAKKKEKEKISAYEDTFNFLIDENLWDAITLYRETWNLKQTATDFINNDWIDLGNIRVISFIS